jgi:nucleotide-binding universal stress UspA family protein
MPCVLAGFNPETADQAPVDFAVQAARMTGAPLLAVAVHAGTDVADRLATGEFADELPTRAWSALQRLHQRLQAEPGIRGGVRLVEARSPACGLQFALEREHAALLVLGSTGDGKLGRVAPGSTAERVVHGASCSVTIVPHDVARPRLSVICAAMLPGKPGRAALRAACVLARAAGARVRALMVLRHTPDREERLALARLVSARRPAGANTVAGAVAEAIIAEAGDVEVEPEIFVGEPADTLVRASRHADLLVLGPRAYGAEGTVLLGGVGRRVIAASRCPVLVLPRGVEAPLDDLFAERCGNAA